MFWLSVWGEAAVKDHVQVNSVSDVGPLTINYSVHSFVDIVLPRITSCYKPIYYAYVISIVAEVATNLTRTRRGEMDHVLSL